MKMPCRDTFNYFVTGNSTASDGWNEDRHGLTTSSISLTHHLTPPNKRLWVHQNKRPGDKI